MLHWIVEVQSNTPVNEFSLLQATENVGNKVFNFSKLLRKIGIT